jgi:PAS domain S-box-containing protein
VEGGAVFDFLMHLFDTSGFPPRWQCGSWTAGHGFLHILSDLGVWSAYVAIPCVLVSFVVRRQDIPFRTIFWLFGAFILACGTTHLMEALLFWWPAYRLAGAIKLCTALISWATVISLVPIVPRVLTMRSPEELEREIAARKDAEAALEKANAELARQVEALRTSDERFRLLVEGSKDHAIFMLDPTGRVSSWNPGAERIKQYRGVEIIGQHFSRFYPVEEAQAGKPERGLRQAAAEGRYEDEGWRLRKDGSRFWANVVITALRDDHGSLRGFSKITRDMTERKQAQETARRLLEEAASRRAAEEHAAVIWEERERLRVTLHSIGDGVIATDAEARVTLLNPVAETLTGWSEQKGAYGKPLTEVFNIINEQTRRVVENPVAKVLREGQIVGLANHTILIAADGTERPIADSAAPIENAQGQTVGVVLVFRDVSEERRAEEALRAADRRKNEFLAILAHELRNPLAPIRNGLQVLRLAKDRAIQEQTREMMERQLGQLVRLVDDLLDISRITRNKLELRKARIPLASVVENAVETARPLIDSKGHTLTVTLPPEPIFLDADLTRLAQVFWNLLHNSAKYTDPGGRIELLAQRQGSEVVVTVRDTGIGLPAEAIPNLFTLFSQVDRSLERSQGGLGIGLALVKGLVQMHGGTIEVHSPGPGQGSTFIVRLPVAPQPQGPSPAVSCRPGTSRRVLVVDDNRDVAASLAMMLSLMGHDTRTAHDGFEAVELAEAFRPDVVLLDLGLPKLNGYDACQRIRQEQWGKGLYIVAVTGWGQEEDRRRSQEAGFDQHLVKPVDLATLDRILAGLKPAGR